MTYLPTPPASGTANAGPLTDDTLLPVVQSGVTRRATLATLKAFLAASTTAASGTTGSSTGPTGSTSGGSTGTTSGGFVAPANRIGTPASTLAVKNTAKGVVPVVVPTLPSRTLPAYTPNATESPNGTVIDSTNYTTKTITCPDGNTIGLSASTSANRIGMFTIMRNGAVMGDVRLDLVYGVKNAKLTQIDDVIQIVYFFGNCWVMTDHGLGDQNWFKLEGSGPDLDTCGDDPRQAFLVPDPVAPVGDPPYGLGAHPASVGDEPRFTNWLNQFNAEIGTPAYVNCFLSVYPDFSGWGNEAYNAARSLLATPLGKNIIPVLGMGMSKNSDFGPPANNQDFKDFAAGVYDTNIKDAVKAYLHFFDELHVRPGYEANGNFMAWNWGGQNGESATGPLWVAAFQHIYTVCHAACAEAATIEGKPKALAVTWNPAAISYNTLTDPRQVYPGDAYCDYIGLDIYSPQYTNDLTNWSGDGVVYNTDPNIGRVQQALNPINRVHFHDYPAGKGGLGSSTETGGTTGWGVQDNIAFALAHNKPLAFPECGCGANFADGGLGPAEDYVFPFYLRSRCDQFVNNGGKILYLNIWAADEGDGGWGFLYGQRRRQALAWSQAFGGTGAALRYVFPTAGTSAGSTGTTATGSTGAAASGGAGPASAVVTDTAGKVATLSLPNPPVTNNGTFQTFYVSNTGLLTNVNYFVGTDGNLYLDGVTDADLTSAVVTRNGLATLVSLIPNSTYK